MELWLTSSISALKAAGYKSGASVFPNFEKAGELKIRTMSADSLFTILLSFASQRIGTVTLPVNFGSLAVYNIQR
eukprot:CAMPEP_0115168204 /NCGR_PEP_ID=MMETSP0270-20121206/626_1 /TAXON_ID=71861 /ORGANISM="Scrippsiella trochoidea, Strain CCMP3099" /LENGTH=74 /DNA_ID=CAMNT_0002580851 /DNA_START=247 /DNA_END=472 /DNA_ORIENTATION=+